MPISFTYTQAAFDYAYKYHASIYASEQIQEIYGYEDLSDDRQFYHYCDIKDAVENGFCYVPTQEEVSQAENFVREMEEGIPF